MHWGYNEINLQSYFLHFFFAYHCTAYIDIEIIVQEYRNNGFNGFNCLQLLNANLGKRISIILVNG